MEKIVKLKRHTIQIDEGTFRSFERIARQVGFKHGSAGIISLVYSVVRRFEVNLFYGLTKDEFPPFYEEISKKLDKIEKDQIHVFKQVELVKTSHMTKVHDIALQLAKIERIVSKYVKSNAQDTKELKKIVKSEPEIRKVGLYKNKYGTFDVYIVGESATQYKIVLDGITANGKKVVACETWVSKKSVTLTSDVDPINQQKIAQAKVLVESCSDFQNQSDIEQIPEK